LPGQELNNTVSGIDQARGLHMARILTQTDALLGALKQYEKLGRYASAFPEKPYFLFSQCARLLYDFENARQDCQPSATSEGTSLFDLLDRLNFGCLQSFDCKPQTTAPTSGQQFRNESEWYRFWFQVIEAAGHLAGADLVELRESLLKCVGAHGVLVSKLDKSARKAVAKLFRTALAGRLVVHTEWVLEDISGAIASLLAGLGTREHTLAQAQSLVCALKQIRRYILWHTAATGPYIPNRRHCWGVPGGLAGFRLAGKPGTLTTRLPDEGGTIACVFEREDGPSSQPFSWSQDVEVLESNYEKALFETWSYEAGTPVHAPSDASIPSAQWRLGSVEASYLEFVSQRAELLLGALARHAPHEPIIVSLGDLLKSGADGRDSGRLDWTYVKEIDVMIQKLEASWRPLLPRRIESGSC